MFTFLSIAGISTNFLVLVGAGGLVGLLSGLLGVGGGFLLTPLLIMIGIPPTVAAASDSCQIVGTSSSGMAAHFRMRHVDLKMGAMLVAGGLPGTAIGVKLIHLLRASGKADLLITFLFVIVLGFTGSFMLIDSLRNLRGKAVMAAPSRSPARSGLLAKLPFQMDFSASGVRHSVFVPLLLAATVGLLTTIMGVGGGFILVPTLVYLLGMPMHVAIGTSLFQILFTCTSATYLQAVENRTVDLILALFLLMGSTIGAQVGARLTRFLRGSQLMILLAVLALGVMFKMAAGLVLPPSNILEPLIGH